MRVVRDERAVAPAVAATWTACILDAFTEGRAVPWPATGGGPASVTPTDGEPVTFGGDALAPSERAALQRAAVPREQALALARDGRLDEGDGAMRLAQLILAFAPLSAAGRAYGVSMHEAAASFLAYRRGDHAAAYDRMAAALAATERLAAHCGESRFIACRRVDLEHNLMRVEMRNGAVDATVERGARLLRGLADGSSTPGATVLGTPLTTALADLVTSTLAEAVAPLGALDARAMLRPLAWMVARPTPPSVRAVQWLALKLRRDVETTRHVNASAAFLRAGRGSTPTLWYGVVLDLLRLSPYAGAPREASALEPLATELAVAPRVPASMRVEVPRRPCA